MHIRFFICCAALCLTAVSFAQTPQRDTVVVGKDFTYEGKWPEGEGVLYSYESGLVIGTFKEGVPDGICIHFGAGGRKYWGEFRNGKWNGHGHSYKPGGIVVVGDFADGRQHGTDTIFREDKSALIAIYNKGKFVKDIKEYDYAPRKLRRAKPDFPKIELTDRQTAFIKDFNKAYKARRQQKKSNLIKPKFMGMSITAFSGWVNGQLKYPKEARKQKIEGTVIMQFTVDINGRVKDVHVHHSSGNSALDNEALRVVSGSPDWSPATQDGKPVEYTVNFPVDFYLSGSGIF